MPDELIISKIRKNAANEIWVALKKFKGSELCDIREYFLPDASPNWLPTKKGISFPRADLAEVVDAAEKLASSNEVGTVAEIVRGTRTKACFAVREFNKHIYAEIRVYFQEEGNDAWKPGKGVTLPLSKVAPVVEALQMAEESDIQL